MACPRSSEHMLMDPLYPCHEFRKSHIKLSNITRRAATNDITCYISDRRVYTINSVPCVHTGQVLAGHAQARLHSTVRAIAFKEALGLDYGQRKPNVALSGTVPHVAHQIVDVRLIVRFSRSSDIDKAFLAGWLLRSDKVIAWKDGGMTA